MEDSKAVPQSRKRPHDKIVSTPHESPCYKARAFLKDLRPHFIQVLKTPDFRNCKAADDIREGMKRLIDLYKGMISDAVKMETSNTPQGYSSPSIPNELKPAGTHIVGGSAFGWNFITFESNASVYYGRSKEDFRAANPMSGEGEKTNS